MTDDRTNKPLATDPVQSAATTLTVRIRRVGSVTPTLQRGMARLLPQLSDRLPVPDSDRLQTIVASPSSALFVAERGDSVVGMLTLAWYDVPSGRKAWVEDVVVDAAERGTGVGAGLVDAALDHAARLGASRVMLTSSPAREAAHRLYGRKGFTRAETTVFVRRMGEGSGMQPHGQLGETE